MAQNLRGDLELLRHVGRDARGGGGIDHRAHFGAEDAFFIGACEQRIEIGHGFHQLHAVVCIDKALVDFQKRHHAAVLPEVLSCRCAVDLTIHGHFKEDGTDHLFAGEGGRFDDPAAHGMHHVKHLGLAGILIFVNAVEFERFRRGPAGLIEGGNKPVSFRHFRGLISVCHAALRLKILVGFMAAGRGLQL